VMVASSASFQAMDLAIRISPLIPCRPSENTAQPSTRCARVSPSSQPQHAHLETYSSDHKPRLARSYPTQKQFIRSLAKAAAPFACIGSWFAHCLLAPAMGKPADRYPATRPDGTLPHLTHMSNCQNRVSTIRPITLGGPTSSSRVTYAIAGLSKNSVKAVK
jgi:hypothetical protein